MSIPKYGQSPNSVAWDPKHAGPERIDIANFGFFLAIWHAELLDQMQ